ncbi:Rrp1p [Sugiyamaella lignohabitans]|uniref:Rrp1p n=1 Tax=Sugiyamaella lignohabitans TaxID=796027 RepID=A0A167EME6_9ASCO|nr:Rrp1p [Sugiyamaella lignohabitans]ANB14251.1 Rrp1p [Sugiyamaella lignohabitans]
MPAVKKSSKSSSKSNVDGYIKKLAANDRPTRDDALKSLTQFLSTQHALDEMELLKLWKGLFFTMWFSDRPRTQQRLADDMANLLATIHKVNFFAFLEAFWAMMAREWDNIDKHRVDKYYLLMRRYLAASLRRLQVEEWDSEWVDKYTEVMTKFPLNATDAKVSNGLRLHMFDIYIDEIERIMNENGDDEDAADAKSRIPFGLLLKPIEDISQNSPLKFIRERAKTYVLEDPRLVEWGVVEKDAEEADEESEDEWGGFD